jgi:hypothetical protein
MAEIYDAIVKAEVFGFTASDQAAINLVRSKLIQPVNSSSATTGGWEIQLSSSPQNSKMIRISMDWYEKGGTNYETFDLK